MGLGTCQTSEIILKPNNVRVCKELQGVPLKSTPHKFSKSPALHEILYSKYFSLILLLGPKLRQFMGGRL